MSSKHRVALLVAIVLSLLSAPATAAVQISFYSRDLGGNNFPHAFIRLSGQPDDGGQPIDSSFGFTAKAVTPAVLMGSVGGMIMNEPPAYVAKSNRHFSFALSDAQYRAVLSKIQAWRTRAQPSYNLNKANCVHFVGEIAEAAGLQVPSRKDLMKKPKSFLLAVKQANPHL